MAVVRNAIVACAVALLLGACASSGTSRLVPVGEVRSGKLVLTSEMEWTRATSNRSQLWTIDGELLNMLYLVHTVKEGDYIFLGQRESKRRPDAPYYHKGMREDELRDLVSDGLLSAGFIGVSPSNLRPASFGTHSGLRFDLDLQTGEGLQYQGLVAMFEHDKGLALAIFIAPREYYFPRDSAKVSRMLDTLRLER
ncbi:hypothetical protein LF41_2725 [Lysobacter dokdonensis DS-58]|uniref:Lipoprotein n=1 Tax=Lysobacter dokdonensis DS-58 TaxID=1300345 RepID=A0A0A2WMF9_9GAMM|nr:hypothetical protein [Lysobacter dokdonensis]KGQ19470.1 hypothetical protein LF41_2725 [Lysobacter dokdonensis DS-58]